MKRLIVSLIICVCTLQTYAQRFSPEEYEQRYRAFITERVGLTKAEADKFFPMYQELKNKQRANWEEARRLMKNTNIKTTSEAEFRKLNDRLLQLDEANNNLEAEYLKKFRKIISDKKYFMISTAEKQFQRKELRDKHEGHGRR